MLRSSIALKTFPLVASSLLVGALGSLGGCSSSTSSTSSSGALPDAGGTDSGGEAGAVVVNSCNTFVDRSAATASRTITWDFGISTAPERCLIVKKGEDVTYAGDFATHPLGPSGGDTPNPFATVDTSTGKVSFPAKGTFGFACGNHPSMTGAVQVIE